MIAILYLFLICSLLQISYWIFYYAYFPYSEPATIRKNKEITPVSIIICFKNETKSISENIDSWLQQLEGSDELILVDDFSTDNSYDLVKSLQGSHEAKIKLIKASNDVPGKKGALSDGVKAAQNPIILVTDADCKLPIKWKIKMLNEKDKETKFVLGYAPFITHQGFLNLFQRFENLITAIQYFSFAHAGAPYMGVGRNMLFAKNIFDEEIFSNSNIASGDDDLLVSAKANKLNTSLCLDPSSFVFSEAKPSVKSYFIQKSRHAASSTEYKLFHQVLLAAFATSQFISNLLFIILLFSMYWKLSILAYVIRISVCTLTISKTSKILKQEKMILYTPLLDMVLSGYYLLLSLLIPLKKKSSWN